MKFSVASWHLHHRDPDWWIAHNGWTTMASPPPWPVAQRRNIPVFAPPAKIVFGHYPPDAYTPVYRDALRQRLPAIERWIAQHVDEHVILLCACAEGKFCHRHLLAEFLVKLGCEQVPLLEGGDS